MPRPAPHRQRLFAKTGGETDAEILAAGSHGDVDRADRSGGQHGADVEFGAGGAPVGFTSTGRLVLTLGAF